jgi:hypothetical protein
LTLAHNTCATKFQAQRKVAVGLRGKNAKVPRRMYERIIEEVEDTYNVEKGTFKIETVRRRMYKRNMSAASIGPTSPMAGI